MNARLFQVESTMRGANSAGIVGDFFWRDPVRGSLADAQVVAVRTRDDYVARGFTGTVRIWETGVLRETLQTP